MKRLILVLGLLPLLAGCRGETPEGKLYVSNVLGDTVSVVDAASGKVVRKIPVGTLPHNFAFTPDERHLVLTNTGSQSVSVIDTETDAVVREVLLAPIPANAAHAKIPDINRAASCKACHPNPVGILPAGIARSPDGDHFLITNLEGPSVTRLNARTFEVEATYPLTYATQPHPSNVIFHPSRDEVYVLNRSLAKKPGRLTVLDRRMKPKRDLEVIKQPWGMVVGPDGSELYIASRVTNKIQVWNTDTWTLMRTLTPGDGPVGLYLSANGKLYTANYYTNRPSYMSVLDAQSGRTLKQIPATADLTMMATDPAKRFMYLVNSGGNKIQVIDLKTDTVVKELPGGAFPLDIAYKRR